MAVKVDRVGRSVVPFTVLLLAIMFFVGFLRNGIPFILGSGIFGVFPLVIVAGVLTTAATFYVTRYSINKLSSIWRN